MLNIIIGRFFNQSFKAFANVYVHAMTIIEPLENYLNNKAENLSGIISKYNSRKVLSGKDGVLLTPDGEEMIEAILSEFL